MQTLRVFDEEWAKLAPRLGMVLAARGVLAQDRDDLVQETALRLYRVWETLAPEQPVWPFAVTIALNLWRDQLRASVVRQRDVLSANLADSAGEQATGSDVERTVLARQELASVGAVMRSLAPEQRRLLLANDETAPAAGPLRPAERMARMRARRELARMVGRASAALALLWWRRPLRSTALATAACAGVLAATVMTNTPLVMPAPTAQPDIAVGAARPLRLVDTAGAERHRSAAPPPSRPAPADAPVLGRAPLVPAPPPTRVCAPARPDNARHHALPVVSVGSGGIYEDGSDGERPIVETPALSTDKAGCLHVG